MERERARQTIVEVQHQQALADVDAVQRIAQSLHAQSRQRTPDTDERKEGKRSEEETDDDDDILVGQPTLRVPVAASTEVTSQGYALDNYRDSFQIGPMRKDRVFYCPIPSCRDHINVDDEMEVKQALDPTVIVWMLQL